MAGLGLSDAVSGYAQGVAWKDQQGEIAREKARRDAVDAANQTASQVVKDAEAEDYSNQRKAWMDNGAPEGFQAKPFVPPDNLMFKVSQDRGTALMKAGLIDEAAKNEALTQLQRLRVRQSALERWRLNKDDAALAKAVYSTVPDGKEITGAETIEGAPGGDAGGSLAGMPMRPSKIRLQLSDGTTHDTTPEEIRDVALRLSDPKYADHEAAMNMLRLKEQLTGDRESRVADRRADREAENIDRRGTQDRRTEGVKSDYALTLEGAKSRTSLAVADKHAGATLGAATTHADAVRYGADKHAESSEAATNAKKDENKIVKFRDLSQVVIANYGKPSGPMAANNSGNADTAAIMEGAKRYLADNPDADVTTAMNKAAEVLGLARKPKK